MCVCDVCGSRPEFLTEDIQVWRIIRSIHLKIKRTIPDKKIPPASFPFPVPNVEGMEKLENVVFSDR
jgi:hypothetical protein